MKSLKSTAEMAFGNAGRKGGFAARLDDIRFSWSPELPPVLDFQCLEIEHGERGQAAKQESSGSGTTSAEGLLGDKKQSDKALAGNAPSDDPDAQSDADMQAAATGVVRMLESAREAEILLNRIKDDPAKVLRARFRAIHRQRVEERQLLAVGNDQQAIGLAYRACHLGQKLG